MPSSTTMLSRHYSPNFDTTLNTILVVIAFSSAFFTIFVAIGPSRFPQACKTILNYLIYLPSVVLVLLPVISIALSTMFVGLFAFIMSLGASSALVGDDCSDMSTIQATKFESKAFLCSCKIILDNFNAQTYPVVFLFGLCATTVLLAAFIYNRREDRKDLRCLVAERLAKQRDLIDTQHTIQRSVKAMSDVDASLNCLICVDRLTQPYTLAPCGHTFDLDCLQGWFRAAHPSPADEELALALNPRGALFTLRKRKYCPLCHTEVGGPPAPARALLVLGGMEPPAEGNPWRGLFMEKVSEFPVEA
ncbi:OPT oligopeptide transporter [Mycena venus]|uniref:OPT oligopeptide transporter n=1 Tax=Mycena venus TaxID=2733690 RepID=A0A8H6XUW3_9AGAR|nr:OPT oligopeptide transporter [Mycena venus]